MTDDSRGREEESCDGLHDEGAPLQYLCTRCFPTFPQLIDRASAGGDLLQSDGDDYVEDRRDDDREME